MIIARGLEPRCPKHGTSIIDGWCLVIVGGEPHEVTADDIVDCPDGCPFVIYHEDWQYHLGWHREMAKSVAERYGN